MGTSCHVDPIQPCQISKAGLSLFIRLAVVLVSLSVSACGFTSKPDVDQSSLSITPLPFRRKTPHQSTPQKRIVQKSVEKYPDFPKFDEMKPSDPDPERNIKTVDTKTSSLPALLEREDSSIVQASQVPNPVDLVRQAGATSKPGAQKGEFSIAGYWKAEGEFPASSENSKLAFSDTIDVYSFRSVNARDEHVADRQTDDRHKVLIGIKQPFYVIVTRYGSDSFDVSPSIIAGRLNAYLKP